MLETIKFQTSTIKLISPYYNLGGPKLTTLYLVCDCKISSILVAFYIVSFMSFGFCSSPSQVLIRSSTRIMHISFYSLISSMIKKQISQINTPHLPHEGHSPKSKNAFEET